ncbi:MAG: thioredoxin [Clostridia bacterium]
MKILSSKEFEEKIKEENKVVLVDFFATWCGPCKMLAPLLEQASHELKENQEIYKLDIDESLDIAKKFGVMSVPTMIIFKDGKEVNRVVGLRQKAQILEAINKF